MKSLKQAAQDYIRMRRDLGFKMRHEERRLKRFVSFMEVQKASYITTKLALKWATEPADAQRATWAERLMCVRVFARYCSGADPRTEVPPPGILPFHPQRATPYLYSEEEIRRLMEAARCLAPSGGLRGLTYHCLFGLLTVTGLRISEALALTRKDVDLRNGLLTIRGAKFGKTRLVPLHPSACRALSRYAQQRDELLDPPRADQLSALCQWPTARSLHGSSCLLSTLTSNGTPGSVGSPWASPARLSPSLRDRDLAQVVSGGRGR